MLLLDKYDRKAVPDSVRRSFETEPVPEPPQIDAERIPSPPAAPWSIRVTLWLVYIVRNVTLVGVIRAFSRLIRRATIRVILWYPRIYGFVVAITGGKVEDAEYGQRMAECGDCPGVERRGTRMYCGPCGCPHWWMAELHRKNRWKRHYCPEERHTLTDYPRFVTISPSGCGQRAFKIPGGRAHERD